MWPPRKSSGTFDTWLKRILTIFQIIAIPIGAYWIFTRFQTDEAPALGHRAKIGTELFWTDRSKEECIAQFKITFENIGKSSIDLIEAVVRAYPLDAPTLKDDTIVAYVDPIELRENLEPLVEANIRKYLLDRFPPGVADEVGAMFIVKKDPGKMIMFFVDATSAVSETLIDRLLFLPRERPREWSWFRRDFRCGEPGLKVPENVK